MFADLRVKSSSRGPLGCDVMQCCGSRLLTFRRSSASLHDVTTQRTSTSIFTIVETSDLSCKVTSLLLYTTTFYAYVPLKKFCQNFQPIVRKLAS